MIGSILYLFFIYPIELFIETVFSISMKFLSNPGVAICFVSLFVQISVLPLYKKADKMQEIERAKQNEMQRWVTHIKKTFRKDERFMMLSEYYRQQGYDPLMSLRGSISLLLQIPFFIAAYHYLSNLDILNGTPFLMIRDLGIPDALISAGTIKLNLLPILMTVINLLSGAVYMQGYRLREKIQLLVTALVFLVLLYDSPAGLVLYWTLNNLFSLLKNIVMKVLNAGKETNRNREPSKQAENGSEKDQAYKKLFIFSGAALAVLSGLWIPSQAVAYSPLEFVIPGSYADPLIFVIEAFSVSLGIFILWFGIFYVMAARAKRRIFSICLAAFLVCGLCQTFLFSRNMGNMSNIMVYDFETVYSVSYSLLNLAALGILAAIVAIFSKKQTALMMRISAILFVGLLVAGALNLVKTEKTLQANSYIKNDASFTEGYPTYSLSRNGRNVIVLMLDRAINGYLPYIMEEFPELKEQYSGFTYYPNTYSNGGITLTGGPALYGGYDFLPMDMAENPELIQDKLNASVRLLPYNFSHAGFQCTVFDPPDYIDLGGTDLAGFFEGIDHTQAYYVGWTFKSPEHAREEYEYLHNWSTHNDIRHSLYILAPWAIRSFLYDDGNYLGQDKPRDTLVLERELDVLRLLPQMADISEEGDNLFVITNLAAHSYAQLQLPDFEISDTVDNTALIDEWSKSLHADSAMPLSDMTDMDRFRGYCANVAAIRAVGEWMDQLKSEGVYDNTRIVIVADHGFASFSFPQMIYEGGTDFAKLNPLLMVKDFNESDYHTDDTLMSNADTVAIAMEGIIHDPVDPYDNSPARITYDKSGEIELTDYQEYDLSGMKDRLYTVHTDVRQPENWKVLFGD